jgi:hypothetical protein
MIWPGLVASQSLEMPPDRRAERSVLRPSLTAVSATWPIGILLGAVAFGVDAAGTMPRAAPDRHRARTTQARRA